MAKLTERNLKAIPLDFLRWAKDPISGEGGMRVARMVMNVIGPEFEDARRKFKANPIGQQILKDRPSLEAMVLDMDRMKEMPAGTLGNEVYKFMHNDDYIIPGYMIPGFFMMGGYYDSLEKDEEMDYLIHRFFFAHDLHHVIGGYGPDPCGEALNAMFTAGWSGLISRQLSYLTFFGLAALSMTPKVGRKAWLYHLDEAYDRGAATRRKTHLSCVYWEKIIDKPIEEGRAVVGVPPSSVGHMTTSDWMAHSRLTDAVINSFGKMPRLKKKAKALTQAIDEYGVSWRDIFRVHPDTMDQVAEHVMRGPTTKEAIQRILARA
ncbi:MAG: Coq4 family protein [Bdellovibrionota bacterium]